MTGLSGLSALPVVETYHNLVLDCRDGREHRRKVILVPGCWHDAALNLHPSRFLLGHAEVLLHRKGEGVAADAYRGSEARYARLDDGKFGGRLPHVNDEGSGIIPCGKERPGGREGLALKRTY